MLKLGCLLALMMLGSCEEVHHSGSPPAQRITSDTDVCKDTIIKCDFGLKTEHRSCPHPSQNVEVVKGEGYFWGGCNSDPVCLCRCPKTALAKPVFQ